MALGKLAVDAQLVYTGDYFVSVDFENETAHLYYCDYYLDTFSVDDVTALLTHEVCHIATFPSSRSLYFTEAPQIVIWFDQQLRNIYCEWLAHNEFLRRFGKTERFERYRMIKIAEFESYDVILERTRGAIQSAIEGLCTIFYDAVFFPAVGDDAFAKWADSNDLSASLKLLGWILEDFQYVRSLKLNRSDVFIKLRNIGKFCLSVDMDDVMSANRIRFVNPPPSLRDDALIDVDSKIDDNWKERMIWSQNCQNRKAV